MDAIEELQAQLREAEYLANSHAPSYGERVLAHLVANVIQREIERLQENSND
jgi:hypothetical protein